jgi:hypothetical protein
MIFKTIVLLVVLLWLPSLSAPGGMDANFFVPVPLFLLAIVIARREGLNFRVASPRDQFYFSILATTIVCVTLLALLSMFYADDSIRVFRVITGELFGLALLFGILSLPDSERRLNVLTDLMIWGAVLSSAFVTASYYIPVLNIFAFGTADRTAAFFKHPNQFGMALSTAAPVLFAKCITDKRKALRVVQLVLIYFGLVFSGSKTNLVLSAALAFAVFGFGLWQTGFLRRHPIGAPGLVALGIAGAAFGFQALSVFNPRAQQLLLSTASGDAIVSWQARLVLWQISISDGLSHPWFGVGAGQDVSGTAINHSHNVFLDYFRTMGTVGLGLLTAQILATVVIATSSFFATRSSSSQDLRVTAVGLGFSVLGYILANQFSDSFGPSTVPLFWLSVALLLYARRMVRWTTASPQRRAMAARPLPSVAAVR